MLENGDNQLARLPAVMLAVSEKTDRAAQFRRKCLRQFRKSSPLTRRGQFSHQKVGDATCVSRTHRLAPGTECDESEAYRSV
jgi:hypothetical protein